MNLVAERRGEWTCPPKTRRMRQFMVVVAGARQVLSFDKLLRSQSFLSVGRWKGF